MKDSEIDIRESIPPACVAWRAGKLNRVVVPVRQAGNRFLVSLKGLQKRALYFCYVNTRCLKGPKHEIFESGFFTQIRGLWLSELGTGEKIEIRKLESLF